VVSEPKQVTEEIIAGLDSLTSRQLVIVAAMVKQLNIPVNFTPAEGSNVVDPMFAEEMSNLLSLHHSTHESPLKKEPFEYAFKQCLIAQGHAEADLNPRPGESACDVFGNNERWSLKTEAAKSLSRNQVKIEKLSEARWVREATTPEACAIEVRERIPRHMDGYDRILVLRAETRPDHFTYTLEEVPKELLRQSISAAEPYQFAKTDRGTKKGISYGANFVHPFNGDTLFRMLLDSSVEKVRVWFQTRYCIHHGTWVVWRPTQEVPLLY
jgi:Type II site-specific deoxyribonuclease